MPVFGARIFGGSNRKNFEHRGVAQLVAHLLWEQGVARSNRVAPTIGGPFAFSGKLDYIWSVDDPVSRKVIRTASVSRQINHVF